MVKCQDQSHLSISFAPLYQCCLGNQWSCQLGSFIDLLSVPQSSSSLIDVINGAMERRAGDLSQPGPILPCLMSIIKWLNLKKKNQKCYNLLQTPESWSLKKKSERKQQSLFCVWPSDHSIVSISSKKMNTSRQKWLEEMRFFVLYQSTDRPVNWKCSILMRGWENFRWLWIQNN